jgi:hypothetical protein
MDPDSPDFLLLALCESTLLRAEKLPVSIGQTAKDALAAFKQSADAAAQASMATAKADLAAAVSEAAHTVAKEVAGASMLRWACGCAVVVSLCMGGMWWLGHKGGETDGYAKAQDEKAALAWSSSVEGQAAYRMAKSGALKKVSECNQPGWVVKKGVCFPMADSEGNVHGWLVP